MKLIKEFKTFAIKGNMLDIAIGVIIGASFNKVVDVLVKKVILPPLSLVSNGIDLKDKKLHIINDVYVSYGEFIEAFFNFLIVGIALFGVVKALNTLKRRAQDVDDATVETPKDIQLLADILKELKHGNKT